MKLLPLSLDELIAIVILIVTFLPLGISGLETLQPLAVFYLFMCVAFRKYEAIKRKYK